MLPRDPLALVTLTGGFVFAADLLRALAGRGLAIETDTLQLSSYGRGSQSLGTVRLVHEADAEMAGRTVLLIDDILDSGRTLAFARAHLAARGAASVIAAVLLDKPARRSVPARAEFVGFTIPDVFVVGYGLDLAGRYRELPDVCVLAAPPGASRTG